MMFNPQIKEILNEFGIPEEDALAYLLSIYYDVRPSYTPPLLIQRINTTNILTLDEEKMLVWRFPLFLNEEVTDKRWNWVVEWMDGFSKINSTRRGTKSSVIKYMKTFFSENPDVRQDEVIAATKLYFKNVDSPTYLKKSHKFIYEGAGKFRVSMLEEWIEKYRLIHTESEEESEGRTSLNTKMQ